MSETDAANPSPPPRPGAIGGRESSGAPIQVYEIATNLDDAGGEVVGAAMEALLAAGALDVWTTPIGMKKNRPGVCLALLCEADQREVMARCLIELTGSFGVRYRPWERLVVERRHVTVATRFGDLRVKVGRLDGRDVVRKVEYEDARKAAEAAGVGVREVLDAGLAAMARPGAAEGGAG